MQTIYHYHPDTAAFVGESLVDPDPLEPGRWLIPESATTDAPPAPGAGQFAAWNGGAWELRNIPAPVQPEPVHPAPA